jgi:hypothetical protein
MHRLPRQIVLCLLTLFLASVTIQAQPPTEEYKVSKVSPTLFPSEKYIDVIFTDRLDRNHPEDISTVNVQVKSLPSNTTIAPTSIQRDAFNPRRLRILIPANTTVTAGDTQIRVCFTRLNFSTPTGGPHPATDVCGMDTILNPANIADKLEEQFQVLERTPKTSDEKNIFASGFAAKGEGDNAEGGTQIDLNSNQLGIPGLFVSLHLNKTTADNADPKHLSAGITYRSTYLFGSSGADETRNQLAIARNPNSTPQQVEAALNEVTRLTGERQKMTLGALFFDLGANLEGEALNFKVTNFVGDAALQLQSRTKKLFGSKNGYWKFRLMPAAIEGGKNLNVDSEGQQMSTPEEAMNLREINYVARFKFGGALTLFYSNQDNNFPFKRVEADIRGVDRYLFLREVMFDETTKMNTMTDKGNKPWFQLDGKFFLADTPNGRFGLKISYNRGSLPPVFADTNSFQFGFIIESADDTKKQ